MGGPQPRRFNQTLQQMISHSWRWNSGGGDDCDAGLDRWGHAKPCDRMRRWCGSNAWRKVGRCRCLTRLIMPSEAMTVYAYNPCQPRMAGRRRPSLSPFGQVRMLPAIAGTATMRTQSLCHPSAGQSAEPASSAVDGSTLLAQLAAFYRRNGLGEVIGSRSASVAVYTGCILVPLPNIETRRRYLQYHDLHHLVTGYSVGRIGEGETSAWELGSGSMFASPTLGAMNLIALSTGLFLAPRRMWQAFRRGCSSRHLYSERIRRAVDEGRWATIEQLRDFVFSRATPRLPAPLAAAEFAGYAGLALVIHAIIAIPAMGARLVTDITLGYSVFEAVKPKQRTDLY